MRERVSHRSGRHGPDGRGPALSIVHRIAAAMALPLAAVILVLGLEIRQVERASRAVREQTELAVSADGPSRLLISLQDEQAWAIVELSGLEGQAELIVEGYDETRSRTDAALAGFEDLLDRSPDATRRAFSPAVEGLQADIDAVRRRIDDDDAPHDLDNLPFSDDVFATYGEMIDPFFAGIGEIAGSVEQRDLRQGAELIHLTARQVTTVGNLGRAVGTTAVLTGGLRAREDIVAVSALRAAFERQAAAIQAKSTGAYVAAGGEALFVGYTEAVVEQVDAAIDGRFDAAEFVEVFAPPPEQTYQAFRERVATILRDRADAVNDAAGRRERLYIGGILLTGTLVAGTVAVVARSLTRPLRSLAEQVMRTAHVSLGQAVTSVLATPVGADVRVPDVEAITVATDDEVGELAAVMNTVRQAVVDLAVEQAVLRRNLADTFVNLGRRNQNLLSRQMDFITELQRHEDHPDTLAALFRLDHLATRMRRNAESLLVLAGVELPGKWRRPVPMLDIVRAALGEVEDYQRVDLTVVEAYTVVGHAASDLSHLLAELLENALVFSPPERRVEVRGLTRPGGYSIAIVDAGVGLAPLELARANRRLAGAEAFTVAPSKYLGHYVAGHLAAKHGIGVRLQASAGPGTTAIVDLPGTLEVDTGQVPVLRFTGEFPRIGQLPQAGEGGG